MKNLGKTIKQIRTSKGLTQRQVCEAAGMNITFLSRIENGRKAAFRPTAATITKIATAMNEDPAELLKIGGRA